MPSDEFENLKENQAVEIPFSALSDEVLMAVIENFVFREGTDYGSVEISHLAKIQQIQKQIEKGEVKILYDPITETTTLIKAPKL